MSNRYGGECHACGKPVAAGAGVVERAARGRYSRWLVWCESCYNRSDNSGPEDRACGDRAYEDACERAVNY